jgi:hypothetical protein
MRMRTLFSYLSFLVLVGFAGGLLPKTALLGQRRGEVEIRAVDSETNKLIAVRMHLKDERGRPVKPPRLPYWHDHFAFAGKVVLELRPGRYTFEIERGPEYRTRIGHFLIRRGATDNKQVVMSRFVDMKKEGWWSGDLHIHRPIAEIPTLMLADDLHIAPVITWWNDRNQWRTQDLPDQLLVQFDGDRYYHVLAGEDERAGGALLYFNLPRPLDLTAQNNREYPSPVDYLRQAREFEGIHVDIEKPFWWDMPVWIATGMVDSIGLANNHLHRDGMLPNEAWGKPRDTTLYPPPLGTGRWSQDIYYQLLETGERIAPSAGSASGVLANPVGYNRVYVHCGPNLDYESWWEGLRAGRVVVTNGPLLRPLVNGQLPGHIFRGIKGQLIELSVQLNLSLRDKVDYLEVVQNGKVVHEVRLEDYKNRKGKLPPVEFTESGWMLVRAVTNNPKTYRFASTGPYYVEFDGVPRISRAASQFFLDWVNQRIDSVDLEDETKRLEVLKYHEAARAFWQDKVESANVE